MSDHVFYDLMAIFKEFQSVFVKLFKSLPPEANDFF
jgi:hypothetical protein